jgi:hypothetical protein
MDCCKFQPRTQFAWANICQPAKAFTLPLCVLLRFIYSVPTVHIRTYYSIRTECLHTVLRAVMENDALIYSCRPLTTSWACVQSTLLYSTPADPKSVMEGLKSSKMESPCRTSYRMTKGLKISPHVSCLGLLGHRPTAERLPQCLRDSGCSAGRSLRISSRSPHQLCVMSEEPATAVIQS